MEEETLSFCSALETLFPRLQPQKWYWNWSFNCFTQKYSNNSCSNNEAKYEALTTGLEIFT
jgi:hypothetical protein